MTVEFGIPQGPPLLEVLGYILPAKPPLRRAFGSCELYSDLFFQAASPTLPLSPFEPSGLNPSAARPATVQR